MDAEVLIIGAGPAGSAAALHLARRGRDVLLVDRCRFPRPKPCGEYYNPEAVRLLGELGVLPAMQAAGAARITSLAVGAGGEDPTGKGAALGPAAPFPVGIAAPVALISHFAALRAECGGNHEALTLGREVLDTLLVSAAARAGVRVWEGFDAEPLLEQGQVVGARLREWDRPPAASGSPGRGVAGPGSIRWAADALPALPAAREVRAGLVLAADGLRSRFARRLGLSLGDGGRRKFGITARCAPAESAAGWIMMQPGQGGSCGLVTRSGEANLGMVVDGNRVGELGGNPAHFLTTALAEYPALRRAVEGPVREVRTVGPLTWITRRPSAAGCLLLGDAAGFYDPFTGQGVTFALLTAELAATVADQALEEANVSAARLMEYAHRRRSLLEPRVRVQQVVQWVMERPELRRRVLERLAARPAAAARLLAVIADIASPAQLLRPDFVRRLL